MSDDRVTEAVRIAATVHAGQVDKGGEPYILHPLFVLHVVRQLSIVNPHEREALLCAAVLHDAIEDYGGSAGDRAAFRDRLWARFGSRCYEALDALTRRCDEDYADYIGRVERDWIARAVKRADLLHNLDRRRMPQDDWTAERQARYETAVDRLTEVEAS